MVDNSSRPKDYAGLMLVHGLRRWANTSPALCECVVFGASAVAMCRCNGPLPTIAVTNLIIGHGARSYTRQTRGVVPMLL